MDLKNKVAVVTGGTIGTDYDKYYKLTKYVVTSWLDKASTKLMIPAIDQKKIGRASCRERV